MEKNNCGRFPECVKTLLISAAYNDCATLSRIDAEKLCSIESFLNKNKGYISQLDCCYAAHYKRLEVFEFLPGHKDLILAIPSLLPQMKGSISPYSLKRNKKTLSDDELKNKLISNLLHYAENIGLEIEDGKITHVNIHNFQRSANENDFLCKCGFICPFCAKVFKLTYKTYWGSSNVTTHFKEHMQTFEQIADLPINMESLNE